jgi:hypothetical protein
MDLSQPFRGSHAIATGLLTPGVLRGPRFRRLFPDIYVPSGGEVDLELLSRAAYLLVAGYGALGGFSAAELLGAGCAPLGTPAEIVAPCRVRTHAGLLVRQDRIPPDELQVLDGSSSRRRNAPHTTSAGAPRSSKPPSPSTPWRTSTASTLATCW